MRIRIAPLALIFATAATFAGPVSAWTQAPPPSLESSHGTILLDVWYNSQTRPGPDGKPELYHYKWDDTTNSGYSLFGEMWRAAGVATRTLTTQPTTAALKKVRFYLIVSPDNPAKNPNPHYMTAADAAVIVKWVKRGGVLLLMENDPANADIEHMDLLADQFGLHFNDVLVHHVLGDDFAAGRIDVDARPPFSHPHVLYMKDTCSLTLSKNAIPLLTWKGDILMARVRAGRGTVVAVTDPWLYNEYTDGKRLPPLYDNYAAGQEFVQFAMQQSTLLH